MKKLIIPVICLLFVSLVLAGPPTPGPVKGTVIIDGQYLDGYKVEVKNERTGEILDSTKVASLVTENGIYTFDMSKFTQGYYSAQSAPNGDTITISFGADKVSFEANEFPYTVQTIETDDAPVQEPVDKLSSNEAKTMASIDLFYGQEVNLVIANNKIAKLLDSEIRFNGEDYDVKEEVKLVGTIKTSIDDVDYLLDPYLEISELSYTYTFDDLIDLEEIDKEEILEILFLGKILRISEVASAKQVTLISGTEYDLMEGDSVEIDGKTLTIKIISSEAVSISYDGQIETIDEGEIGEVGGIEIYVEDVIEDDDGLDLTTIRVGVNIEEVIEDGDDYNDKFEWVIDMPNSIGIINQDPFNDLEDNPPVKAGGVISLPEDFLDIKLSVPSVKMYELNIEVDGAYLLIEGSIDLFSVGTKDYTDVYLNANGFYDEDEVFIGTSVEIGDSDIALEMGSLKIGNLVIKLDMSDILLKGISYALKDEDFLDYLGVIFRDAEQAVEDQKNFEVSVPEERPEATIIIGEDVQADEEPEECPEVVCDETTCKDTVCPSNPECPAEVVCKECPEGDGFGIGAIIAAILGAAGVGVGVTYYTRKDYNTCKGVTVRTRIDVNGNEKVEHYHRGLRNFHDPKTSHSDPKEKHPRGELYPRYEKNLEGKYVYIPE